MSQAPRLRDVAERAGVSVSLVSSYINRPHQVARKSAERIEQAIRDLRFVPNDAARQLRRGSSRMLAFVALDAVDPFFTSVARGAQARAAANGMGLVLADTNGDPETERDYVAMFEEQRVRGILLAPVANPQNYLESLATRRIPAVLIDQPSPDPRWASVSINDVQGGRLAARHLLDLGRRRIAIVGGAQSIRQVADRRRGASEEVARFLDASITMIDTTERDVAAGRSIAAQLLHDGTLPDALFCINDSLAMGVLQQLLQSGVPVPEAVAVIGYNDTAAERSTGILLSSIRQPHEAFGAAAVDLLIEEIDGAEGPRRSIVIEPDLVARESTVGSAAKGAPPSPQSLRDQR